MRRGGEHKILTEEQELLVRKCVIDNVNVGNNRVKPKTKRRILERDNHTCLKCGSTDTPVVNRVVPKLKGGNNKDYNLQTLCQKCNDEKGVDIAIYHKY